MHKHTPSISAIEPRGLAVRAVAYYRRALGDPIAARVTQQRYDEAGRLSQQFDPRLFALSQFDASVPANLSTVQSLSGQTLCRDSVDAGWQLSLPGASGQASESWDQRGWHRRIEHDSLLRLVAVFEHFAEDAERCAERITWGRSSADDALHNRCGQPVRQDDPAGSRLIPDYGISGVVLAEVRHFLYSLDPPDWPVSETERNALLESGHGARSAWRFAATGEVQSQTDAKGHVRQFAHDRAGQLREIRLQRTGQTAAQLLVSAIEYNASGQVQKELAGNGMRTFSSYDPADGHLLSLANQAPGGVFLQNLNYRYDPVGNITEIADAALPIQHFANQRIDPVRRFEYDTLYQLIKATGWETAKPSFGPGLPEWHPFGPPDASRWCNYSEAYDYDAAGNLLERIHLGAENDTLIMQVAAHSNRSIKARPDTNPEALFDARGNLRELQPGQGLQWNGRNELAQVAQVARAKAADDQERYFYDSSGQRVRKWRSTAAKSITHTTEVRYLPGIELRTNSATGEAFHVSTVEAGRCSVRLLHWDSPPPDGIENDQLRFCFDDHLGSSAVEVDAWAKAISQEVFYPYGSTAWRAGRHEVETGYKTIRYSGKERDATGLYYYGARYYAPWLQRWLNPDPAGDVDGLNFYRFVRNNPANYVDKFGEKPTLVSAEEIKLEEEIGAHHLIVQRGRDIFEHLPVFTRRFETALTLAVKDLSNAVKVLESGTYEKELVKSFFGSFDDETIRVLKGNYRAILADALDFESRPERLVVFDPENENRGAFTIVGDPQKKIYLQYNAKWGHDEFSQTLTHELSHTALDVNDKWYLIDQGKGRGMDQMSESMMLGNVDVRHIDASLQVNFIKEAKSSTMVEALSIFRISPSVRTKLATSNPDNLARFAAVTSGRIKYETA